MRARRERAVDGVLAFELFDQWMVDEDVKQEALAESLGVSQQTVSGWRHRRTRPKTDFIRARLEKLSHGRVKRDLWLNSNERRAAATPLRKTGTEAR